MPRVHNFYYHCYVEWDDDDCDSFHNDECPICGKEIEPYSSDDENGDTVDWADLDELKKKEALGNS